MGINPKLKHMDPSQWKVGDCVIDFQCPDAAKVLDRDQFSVTAMVEWRTPEPGLAVREVVEFANGGKKYTYVDQTLVITAIETIRPNVWRIVAMVNMNAHTVRVYTLEFLKPQDWANEPVVKTEAAPDPRQLAADARTLRTASLRGLSEAIIRDVLRNVGEPPQQHPAVENSRLRTSIAARIMSWVNCRLGVVHPDIMGYCIREVCKQAEEGQGFTSTDRWVPPSREGWAK